MSSFVRWAGAVVTVVAVGGVCSTLFARPADLSWEQAFPVAAAKSDVYADARFEGSDGQRHRLQLWRHGTLFLHRRTDAALDLYLEKADDHADYRYRLFDHQRRMLIEVNRAHLYRIGVFSDWFGLAHVLDRPKAAFQVHAATPLSDEHRSDCVWRVLLREGERDGAGTRICWSEEWGLPLVIRTPAGKGKWSDRFVVERTVADGLPAEALVVPPLPDGYATFDAGSEIAPQAGD